MQDNENNIQLQPVECYSIGTIRYWKGIGAAAVLSDVYNCSIQNPNIIYPVYFLFTYNFIIKNKPWSDSNFGVLASSGRARNFLQRERGLKERLKMKKMSWHFLLFWANLGFLDAIVNLKNVC